MPEVWDTDDLYARWPDGTVAPLALVLRGEYAWKSDDYERITPAHPDWKAVAEQAEW